MKESKYYSEEFWFKDLEKHGIENYDETYWAYIMFNQIIFNIKDIPAEGKIVVLGTNNCVSFDF